MGYLKAHHGNRQPSFIDSIGQKAKHAVEMGMALKSIWDVGNTVYRGFVAAAPILEAMMVVGL
jgi:hypothetical protein